MMRRNIFSLAGYFILIGLFAACATTTPATNTESAQPDPVATTTSAEPAASSEPGEIESHRVYTKELTSYREFEKYSVQVGTERFNKLLIDLRTDDIYFFDANVYQMHTDFVFAHIYREPETPERVAGFLANYDEDKPEFLLLYLIHHQTPDVWTFAFWEGDRMRPKHIKHSLRRLKETFFAADRLKFRPESYDHQVAAEMVKGMPVVTNEELYQMAAYQLFNAGQRVGKLRIIDDLTDEQILKLTYHPEEVLLVNEAIPTLTVVSGIISEAFSTPLSHLGLRARAWGIPHIGLLEASDTYRHLDGKMVFFAAADGEHVLREAREDEIEDWKAERDKKRQVLLPPADLEQKKIKPLNSLRASEAPAYGVKSSNLGEIVHGKNDMFEVPPGLAIPIRYYDKHMKAYKLNRQVEKLLSNKKFKAEAEYRRVQLEKLRKAILKAPIDEGLLDLVIMKAEGLDMWGPEQGLFVRSSTNAEDLPGFNGAGLYDTIPNVSGRENLGQAIKQVWASVWNLRAYEERTFFGIDHRKVYGAVLVQQGINATAAGVLVTANIFDPTATTTYTINAKSGLGIRVVEGKKVPEQILFDYENRRIRVLSRSDENTMLVFDKDGGVKEVAAPRGQPILTDSRAENLVNASRAVVEMFPKDAALDIEWLFEGDTLHIVQSRPYVIN